MITPAASPAASTAAPKYESVRIAQVNVRAPYDGTRLAVLRPDGSIAFDAYNTFAASPSALLRGLAEDVTASSGVFARVVHPTSAASTPYALEFTVTTLALDCTSAGKRAAHVDVQVILLKGREVVAQARGTGSVPTETGAYTDAFSAAASAAFTAALSVL